MKDSEVSANKRKIFSRKNQPIVVETITKFIIVNHTTRGSVSVSEPVVKTISLPRVKWLERRIIE